MHGGIGIELLNLGLNAATINNAVREILGKDKTLMQGIPKLLWGDFGPFWYRGMVEADEKYNPISTNRIDDVLIQFGVKRIIVGHCIALEVTGLHGGRVIAVDVNHPENRKAKKSSALLILNGKMKTINDEGKINDLPILEDFAG